MKYNIKYDGRGHPVDEIIRNVMVNRGIFDSEHFLNPTADDMLPLDSLPYIKEGFYLLKEAIDNDWNIGIHADTDTDGITAGTIMYRYLQNFIPQGNLSITINQGKDHGLLRRDEWDFQGIDLLIVVDSIDSEIDKYKILKEEMYTNIIVLDHHAINDDVPYNDYVTLISSQYTSYPNKALSGAGVTWKFCKYCDEQFQTNYADSFVDLAACGILADMMDMTNMENRYIVSEGLSQIHNPAIKKIIGSYEFNSTAVAFSVAPLINSANRMNQNEIALNLFLSNDNKEILRYLKELKQNKNFQGDLISNLLPAVNEQLKSQLNNKMLYVIIDTEYGVSGLLGNKLLGIYRRPVLVLKEFEHEYRGSMRAIGVDDFRAICNESGLATAEGHELASGIRIAKDDFEEFLAYIENKLINIDTNNMTMVDVDLQLDVEDITDTLIKEIKKIDKISGENFKPIKVLVDNVASYEIGQMSDYKHLVIKPIDTKLWIIQWNYNGSFDEMEDASLMNDTIVATGTLNSGFFGRKFCYQLICDNFEVNG